MIHASQRLARLMKFDIQPATLTSCWIVEAHGFSGDSDGANREPIYRGEDSKRAGRVYLEALMLAKVFDGGRGGGSDYSYSGLVEPLFPTRPATPKEHGAIKDMPFSWARSCWSRDTADWDGGDATIEGADVFWVDERGAKRPVRVELSEREQAALDATPRADHGNAGYPILRVAGFLSDLDLEEEVEDPKRPGPRLAL